MPSLCSAGGQIQAFCMEGKQSKDGVISPSLKLEFLKLQEKVLPKCDCGFFQGESYFSANLDSWFYG